MTENQHTPGPWQATEGSYGNYIAVKAERGTVARIPWGKDDTEYDNADAHLIAAAPDLLCFAQQIFNAIDSGLLHFETPAEETLANVLAKGRTAIKDARKEDD